MNLRERYYVLDFFSKAMTVFWFPFVVMMMLLGLSVGWQLFGFGFGLLSAVVFGIVIALPMVIFGQLAGAFLDQAETLVGLKDEGADHSFNL